MRLTRCMATIGLGLVLSGCAAIPKGSTIFTHTPLLPVGTIHARVGLQVLQDRRPDAEQRALKNIARVDEQVTSLLFQDFQQAKLFDSLELTTDPSRVEWLLRGEIQSLTWQSKWNPLPFIPYLNLLALLGFPSGSNQGSVHIALELVDPRTGAVLRRYDKASGSSRTYSIYQSTDYRVSGGEETREALRTVFDELKTALWQDHLLFSSTPPSTQ